MTDRERDFEKQFGLDWRMRISREREIYAEPMLDAENIRREFGCSRAKAYEHLHAALAHFGIVPEAGKQLRIRWSIWQRYKQSRIPWARVDIGSPSAALSGTRTSTRTARDVRSRPVAPTSRRPTSTS